MRQLEVACSFAVTFWRSPSMRWRRHCLDVQCRSRDRRQSARIAACLRRAAGRGTQSDHALQRRSLFVVHYTRHSLSHHAPCSMNRSMATASMSDVMSGLNVVCRRLGLPSSSWKISDATDTIPGDPTCRCLHQIKGVGFTFICEANPLSAHRSTYPIDINMVCP